MNPKELKKLAKACRDAGIKYYKDANIEFTLTDDAPESKYMQAKKTLSDTPLQAPSDPFTAEELTQDQLINWSVAEIESPNGEA